LISRKDFREIFARGIGAGVHGFGDDVSDAGEGDIPLAEAFDGDFVGGVEDGAHGAARPHSAPGEGESRKRSLSGGAKDSCRDLLKSIATVGLGRRSG
jgi:hypothetical protein